jgi:hypothetical protein
LSHAAKAGQISQRHTHNIFQIKHFNFDLVEVEETMGGIDDDA